MNENLTTCAAINSSACFIKKIGKFGFNFGFFED